MHSLRPALIIALLLTCLVMLLGCARSNRGELLVLQPAEKTALLSETPTASVPTSLTKSARLEVSVPDVPFDVDRAMAHAQAITAFGVRPGGSDAESRSAEYVRRRLESMGYSASVDEFSLPNGKTSRNVSASIAGTTSKRIVVIGAHFDTKPLSPGANDNASGCGVALEMARQLKKRPAEATVRFVFFGSEEFLVDAPGDNHHLGSRHDARSLSSSEVANVAAMYSVDMVGYGTKPLVRTMKIGPMTAAKALLEEARSQEVGLKYRKDPGKTGWSDHEPYERLGIPAAWLEWLEDPTYHTKGDKAAHLRRKPMEVSGRLLLGLVRSLDARQLDAFCDR